MAKVIVRHDAEGNTLDLWWGEPSWEFICEEVREGLVLRKDKGGNIIGVEILNWLPIGSWKLDEPIEIDTGMPLREAQLKVKEVSEKYDKEMVYTSAFFITLLSGQLGSVANKYLAVNGGRKAEGIEVDIADIIICSIAYLNWLDKNASEAFEKALKKHGEKLASLNKTPRASRPVAKVIVGVEEAVSSPGITLQMVERAWVRFREELGIKT